MDEYTADAFANREEPLPLLTVTSDDIEESGSDTDATRDSRRKRLGRRLNASRERVKGKAQELHATTSSKVVSSPGRASIQDRLFNKLLEQVIPIEDYEGQEETEDRRSSSNVSRPAFSLGTMSNNFRKFNARIGIVFVFQDRLIRLFTWRTTTHTLSFLAVYTFICLDPYLIIVLPLAIALLFIMVLAFLARHPPPPPAPRAATATQIDQINKYSYAGPPIAPARTIRPAAETSKDFFRNMRDLQNSMADFSAIHDLMVQYIAPATNFSDEVYSSMIFLYLFLLSCILFISAHLLPFRTIFLISGWSMIVSGHPTAQVWLVKQHKKAERKAAQYSDTLQPNTSKQPAIKAEPRPNLYGLPIPNNSTTRTISSTLTSLSEITLSTSPETAEVEMFELQHRPLLPIGRSSPAQEWQHHLYTPTPYDPLSPHRISGSRPQGTRFFEDVQPPTGWTWHTPKWELDLEAGEWVHDRLIVGVEFDVTSYDPTAWQVERRDSVNADFGGWVWDLPPPSSTASGLERDDEVWLAYGDYHFGEEEKGKTGAKKGKKDKDAKGEKDWEEQISLGSRGRTGEWRRRRWVRVVRRKKMSSIE
ncbi:Peroxisome size and maintenance regulator [Lithohypha guttulata]|nr:Peroxisome size and maintenance regulator [Lithohypha guttulata]